MHEETSMDECISTPNSDFGHTRTLNRLVQLLKVSLFDSYTYLSRLCWHVHTEFLAHSVHGLLQEYLLASLQMVSIESVAQKLSRASGSFDIRSTFHNAAPSSPANSLLLCRRPCHSVYRQLQMYFPCT